MASLQTGTITVVLTATVLLQRGDEGGQEEEPKRVDLREQLLRPSHATRIAPFRRCSNNSNRTNTYHLDQI